MPNALEEAPFIALADWPKPKGGGCWWVEAADGARLRAGVFHPEGPARGSVILSPGRTEPIEKYVEVIGELQARGFVVLVHDWRGQGLSDRIMVSRLYGHARGWRPFTADYAHLLDIFAAELPKPWIGVGHSMGGGLTTLALAEGEARLSAAVLSAPMLGVNTGARPLASVRKLSFLMNFVGQSRNLVQPMPDPLDEMFETTILTHDKARWDRTKAQMIACPDLRLGGITWGWLAFALVLTDRVAVSKRMDSLPIPFAVVAAEKEQLVINAASKAVAARAPKGSYEEVAGAYHEILMETDERRAVFWRVFDRVADQVAPKPLPAAKVKTPKAPGKKTLKAAAASKPGKAVKATKPVKRVEAAPLKPRRAAAKSKPR
jgi:lysophospholipase